MYQSRYSSWDEKKFPGGQQFIENLYNRSVQYYRENNIDKNADVTKQESDLKKIEAFCYALEYYYDSLIKMGIVTKQNFSNILQMLSHVDVVGLFFEEEDVYAVNNGNQVSINTRRINIGNLSSTASFLMIVSHELGHIINNSWLDDAMTVSNDLFYDRDCYESLKQYEFVNLSNIFNGFILLDESVSQECAERVTYRMLREERPPYIRMRKQGALSGSSFRTNFNLYEVFQEIAFEFARCLPFLKCSETDDFNEVLEKLAKESFKKNFILQIWDEVKDDSDKKFYFALMLACMGKIKNSLYANYSMKSENNHDITNCLETFHYLANQNKCLIDSQNKQNVMSN